MGMLFNNEIDVADIMEKIKEEVLGENYFEFEKDGIIEVSHVDYKAKLKKMNQEVTKLTEEFEELYDETSRKVNVGFYVAEFDRFGKIVGSCAKMFSRFIRKTISYVIRDQREVNAIEANILNNINNQIKLTNQKIDLLARALDDQNKNGQ